MNLAKGVINTCAGAGIRNAAGWMVSLPQCQGRNQNSASSILWKRCSPLYLATSKFKTRGCQSKTRQISHGRLGSNSGKDVEEESTVAQGHREAVSIPRKLL